MSFFLFASFSFFALLVDNWSAMTRWRRAASAGRLSVRPERTTPVIWRHFGGLERDYSVRTAGRPCQAGEPIWRMLESSRIDTTAANEPQLRIPDLSGPAQRAISRRNDHD
jgi:hypothetical protein